MADSLFNPAVGAVDNGQMTPDQVARLKQFLLMNKGGGTPAPLPPSSDDPMQPPIQPAPNIPVNPNDSGMVVSPPGGFKPAGGRSLADVVGPGKFNSAKAAQLLSVPSDNTQIDPAITRQLAGLLQGQKQGIDESQKNIDLYKSLNKGENLSPLLGLVDAYTGSKLEKSYQAPDSPEQRLETIAKLQNYVQNQRNALSKDVSGLELGDVKNNEALMKTISMMGNRGDTIANRQFASDQKFAQKLPMEYYKSIDPAFATGEFKNLATRYQKNNAAMTILNNNPSGDLDSRQYTTLAMAAAAIENNSNRIAQAMVEHMIPNNVGGFEAKVKELFTNKRYTGQRQDFIRQLRSDLEAENYTTRKQIADNIKSHDPVFLPAFSVHAPGAMENIKRGVMQKYGIKDLDMEDYSPGALNGGAASVAPGAAPGGPPPSPATPPIPSYQEWKAAQRKAKGQ